MHPLVGLSLGGSTLTPFDVSAARPAAVGEPVWGPEQLLNDLELRLGIPFAPSTAALRIARWAGRMRSLTHKAYFYSESFSHDPLGTAEAVLALRDALREAAWPGGTIADGGARLDAIAELEALSVPELPPAVGDRALAVAAELTRRATFHLAAAADPLYDALTFAEPLELWPACFRAVFAALLTSGARLETLAPSFSGAPRDTDLGEVQAALTAPAPQGKISLRGDGTLLLVTAETSLQAANVTAALLATLSPEESVVIREDEQSSLEHSLPAQGVPSQGLSSYSPWRSALQVLPLALELCFEPKNPQRVFELLSLPHGPFQGEVGRWLADAVVDSPGIGGRAWQQAKAQLLQSSSESTTRTLQRVAPWFEVPGSDPNVGASKTDLLNVIARVREWLTWRITRSVPAKQPEDPSLHAAVGQCDALREMLEVDEREQFDLVLVRRLCEFVMDRGVGVDLAVETAGRPRHVSMASALLVPARDVLWWGFTSRYERPSNVSWRCAELLALQRAGIELPDAERLLAERAAASRRAVVAATRRLIWIAPRNAAGEPLHPHPLWDELVARLDLKATDIANITLEASALLRGASARGVESQPIEPRLLDALPLETLSLLALPAAHTEWRIALDVSPTETKHSASSLNELLSCPLRWVLARRAGLRSEIRALPKPSVLSGTLGHRLIEELHAAGMFSAEADTFREHASSRLDLLIEQEGALLLRAGKAHEREQLRVQLLDAACAFFDVLCANGFELVSMEEKFDVEWHGSKLSGRCDARVKTRDGRTVIIDVKWGHAKYREQLKEGRALQLATYARAHSAEGQALPPAVYFSLSGRRLLGLSNSGFTRCQEVDGPALSDLWAQVERTVPLVEATLAQGRLPVVGVEGAQPLLDTLGVPGPEHPLHYGLKKQERACDYCAFDALCGRRWKDYS